MMHRLLIVGNSGSGKTSLAALLSRRLGLPHIELDDVFWEPGDFQVKRADADVLKDIQEIKERDCWIVEGVFGKLIAPLSEVAGYMIFLDPPWEACREGLLRRGPSSETSVDPEVASNSFCALLQWASEYHSRKTKASHFFHEKLFEEFSGKKVKLRSWLEIDQYCQFPGLNG